MDNEAMGHMRTTPLACDLQRAWGSVIPSPPCLLAELMSRSVWTYPALVVDAPVTCPTALDAMPRRVPLPSRCVPGYIPMHGGTCCLSSALLLPLP